MLSKPRKAAFSYLGQWKRTVDVYLKYYSIFYLADDFVLTNISESELKTCYFKTHNRMGPYRELSGFSILHFTKFLFLFLF